MKFEGDYEKHMAKAEQLLGADGIERFLRDAAATEGELLRVVMDAPLGPDGQAGGVALTALVGALTKAAISAGATREQVPHQLARQWVLTLADLGIIDGS